MASLRNLYANRVRYRINDKRFYIAWAKRVFTLKGLLLRSLRIRLLKLRGADVHFSSEVGKIKALGLKRNLKVGRNSYLGRIELALHTNIVIGNFVCINDGCVLLTGSHNINDPHWSHIKKPITIEDYAWISTNVIILPGVVIGKGAVVGAGAVITKNVPPYSIAVGNPFRILEKERIKDLSYNPCEFVASNLAWTKG